jgi:hypothetical protein
MGRLESEASSSSAKRIFATRDKGRGMTCGLDFRCAAKNGGTEVSGKLWMEPRGPMRGLMLLMRLMVKHTLGELPDTLRGVIEAQRTSTRTV